MVRIQDPEHKNTKQTFLWPLRALGKKKNQLNTTTIKAQNKHRDQQQQQQKQNNGKGKKKKQKENKRENKK